MKRGWLGLTFPFALVIVLGLICLLLAISVTSSEGWTTMQSGLVALGVVLLLFGSAAIAFLRLRAS